MFEQIVSSQNGEEIDPYSSQTSSLRGSNSLTSGEHQYEHNRFSSNPIFVIRSESVGDLRSQNPPKERLFGIVEEQDEAIKLQEKSIDELLYERSQMKSALSKAGNIIDEQQEQLNLAQIRAARCETSTEAYKLKSMFLNNGMDVQSEQQMTENERLQADVERLKLELDAVKRSEKRIKGERNVLRRQLNTVKSPLTGHPSYALSKSLSSVYVTPEQEQIWIETLEQSQGQITELQSQLELFHKREHDWGRMRQHLLSRNAQLEEEKQVKSETISELLLKQRSQTPIKNNVSAVKVNDARNPEISRLREERDRWKLYATDLVRTRVENHKETSQNAAANRNFETDNERRWYNYAMHLLKILLEVAPDRVRQKDVELFNQYSSSNDHHHESSQPQVKQRSVPPTVKVVQPKRQQEQQSSTQKNVTIVRPVTTPDLLTNVYLPGTLPRTKHKPFPLSDKRRPFTTTSTKQF